MHFAYMPKDASITVRVPNDLKRRLEQRATRERRSLSAQVLVELERAAQDEVATVPKKTAIGMFEGKRAPTEEDVQEVRAALWGRLDRKDA